MLRAEENNLAQAHALAKSEKALGKEYIHVELVPRVAVAKYVNLWSGIYGEVVGRTYYDEKAEFNADMPAALKVKALIVRVRIADVFEAVRREIKQRGREVAAPLRANRLKGPTTSTTSR